MLQCFVWLNSHHSTFVRSLLMFLLIFSLPPKQFFEMIRSTTIWSCCLVLISVTDICMVKTRTRHQEEFLGPLPSLNIGLNQVNLFSRNIWPLYFIFVITFFSSLWVSHFQKYSENTLLNWKYNWLDLCPRRQWWIWSSSSSRQSGFIRTNFEKTNRTNSFSWSSWTCVFGRFQCQCWFR